MLVRLRESGGGGRSAAFGASWRRTMYEVQVSFELIRAWWGEGAGYLQSIHNTRKMTVWQGAFAIFFIQGLIARIRDMKIVWATNDGRLWGGVRLSICGFQP